MATPFRRLVVLMLENRSFDHMLGFLKSDQYLIEGLTGDETNDSAVNGPPVRVSRDAQSVHDLNPDPGHDFNSVSAQIFGNPPGGPLMRGFVRDYALVSHDGAQGANVMKCFTAATLPVLSTLAQQYAVCDHWYSSVPGPTIPNRLFAHAANSLGSVTQDAIEAPAGVKTIFEIIDDPANEEASFRIYSAGASILMANLYLARHQTGFHPYSDFRDDCLKGDLPNGYIFIEPSYDDDIANGVYANSQHPDFPVDKGEALISDVYNALRDGNQWETSLLLIVYDEHGGIYDHVAPPGVTKDADSDLAGPQPSTDPPFAFDRLGVRVPAVFVSPFIRKGTIIQQPFEHCSIVATVRKLFCLDKTPFNWREAQAATFENVLNLAPEEMRTDRVVLPAPVIAAPPPDAVAAAMPGSVTATAAPKIPPDTKKPTDLALSMAQAMEHTMEQLGMKPAMQTSQIYSAQDAAKYLAEASAALTGGRTKTAGGTN
jgi:phospholipase C